MTNVVLLDNAKDLTVEQALEVALLEHRVQPFTGAIVILCRQDLEMLRFFQSSSLDSHEVNWCLDMIKMDLFRVSVEE